MGTYLINGSKYQIDESIQGEELTNTLNQLAAQPAADPRGAKIDAYLSETDALLGMPAGTSARQLYQESKFDSSAKSKAGAQGIAQVMPATVKALSARLGRPLDPSNDDDALIMHRELMKENMGKFGNVEDALRAYNSGWDKTRWDNPETNDYIQKVATGKSNFTPWAPTKPKVDPAALNSDSAWISASKQLYSLRERKQWQGSDEDAASWGKNLMGVFNNNLPEMAVYGHDVTTNGTVDDQRAFLYMMEQYDSTDRSWEGFWRALVAQGMDPSTWVGIGTLGIGTAGKIAAKRAAKAGIVQALKTALGRTGIVAGVEGAIRGAASNSIKQGVEVSAGAKDSVALDELAASAGVGAGAGLVLGTGGDLLLQAAVPAAQKVLGKVREILSPKVKDVTGRIEPTVHPEVPTSATPSAVAEALPGAPTALPEATPAAPVVHPEITLEGPKLTPETVLTRAEIEEAAARKQQGRLWVDDLPPVTPASPEAAEQFKVPFTGEGLRSTPRSNGEILAAGEEVAKQFREMSDTDLHGTLEAFRNGRFTLEETSAIHRGVQTYADELAIEQAELTKKIGMSTNAQETTAMVTRLAQVEDRLVPLQLADDAMGSMAGSLLQQRQANPFALKGITTETLMAERGLTKEAAEAELAKLQQGWRQEKEGQKVAAKYDDDIQVALDSGDNAEAARLAALKNRELDGVVTKELPGNAGFLARIKEFAISNVFSPTTVAINLIPSAVKTLIVPSVKALATNPLEKATRAELAASYGAMKSTFGGALRAAQASYKYEQSLLTRGTGRLVEGELAMTGRVGGALRFFPRVLNASDEFLGQINYNSFVAGRAAARATMEAEEKGLTGKLAKDYVKLETKIAIEQAYKQPDADALIQPLINKGVNLGYSGKELSDYVMREAAKNPSALRHGSDEEALGFVRDLLYKRDFSRKGTASSLAGSYQDFSTKHPSLSLVVGQLFFRTPVRVFEEGIRLTPGIQILAPGFIKDLAGSNGVLRQARAQGEALTSLAMAGAVLSLYAQGRITGDGAYDKWQAQQTRTDGPEQAPYTIKMSDGSTWSYRSFDPIATPFKIIVNGLERMDKLSIRKAQGEDIKDSEFKKAWAYVSVGTTAIAAAIRDANLASGVDNAIKIGQDLADPEKREDGWLKLMGEKLQLMVPNVFTKIAKQNDPSLKSPADFWQVVETRLAGIGYDDPDIKTSHSYDVLGQERQLADTGSLWNIFSVATPEEAARGHSEEHQFVMKELDRLQRETGAVFTAPLKNPLVGNFDLRTVLTEDGKQTLYDRWNENYRALQPEKILAPVLAMEMPDGTFKNKGIRQETVTKIINELRDAAFKETMAQEHRVMDEVINTEVTKARAKGGLMDYGNRDK